MNSKVFISYRRTDTRYQARMIYEALRKEIPTERLFMDYDSIPLGTDFVEILGTWVGQCDVLLALIGPGWVDVADPKTGQRRLDNPDDFVRVEVREALSRGIPVVPVLLDGTSMPQRDDLPEEIRSLVRRQAAFVEFRTFDVDVEKLINRLGGEEMRRRREAEEGKRQAEGERFRKEADAKRLAEELERRKLVAAEETGKEDEHRPQDAEASRVVQEEVLGREFAALFDETRKEDERSRQDAGTGRLAEVEGRRNQAVEAERRTEAERKEGEAKQLGEADEKGIGRGLWLAALIVGIAIVPGILVVNSARRDQQPSAAISADVQTCHAGTGDDAIAACSRQIASGMLKGPSLAASDYIYRGNAYSSKKDFDHAIQDYDEAIKLDPNAIAYSNRGNAYYSKAAFDSAIQDYDQAIKLDPKYTLTYIGRGNAFYSKKNFDRAIQDYDAAIKLDPNLAMAYYSRGNAKLLKGDKAGGNADIAKAKTIQPDIHF